MVANYLNNVGKGKKIISPVVFQGGVSKNKGVVAAFERTLGCPVLRERFREDRGDWKLDLRFGDGALEIFSIPGAPPRPSYPEARGLRHLAFRAADIEAAVRYLEGQGIACEPIRLDPDTGGRFTFFHDPDGLPLELHE